MVTVHDAQILVLPTDDTNVAKGRLFESFVARLLADCYGFENPTTSNLNVTADGIELDVVATHSLTGARAIAECKAYTRSVHARELSTFYGKLGIARFTEPTAFGLLFALPRLTPDGEESARGIAENDDNFRYISAPLLAEALRQRGLVSDPPSTLTDTSDRAIVITEVGIYSACMVLDISERTPTSVAVWGMGGPVPVSVLDLIGASDYARGLGVSEAGVRAPTQTPPSTPRPVMLTRVAGSHSDFEYHLPASPKFFVGRQEAITRLNEILGADEGRVVVLNAQSGWGKSSLALKLGDMALRAKGVSAVLDSRTADQPRYVVEVLRHIAIESAEAGILSLSPSPSWASLESALTTLKSASWSPDRPIVIFFDQFENVFRDVDLTRAFRDLALGIREIPGPVVLGFAWKTDLVGWTEGHPYQLRDDIRGAGSVIVVEPFGAREVDTILRRLAKEAGVRLLPDLRSRLRAYSQGLPWLLKKLADHLLRELKSGSTQEGLLAESLNVVGLFEADLAELSPSEHQVVKHIARFAPVAAAEVTERFGPAPVQSLVDRRLVVQVGDRLDTYWDTFRDFLNTGSVPVQESWILRQTPRAVSRLLSTVHDHGGNATVRDLTEVLNTSDRAIFNLSRELRLLGVTTYEPNRVRLVDEVTTAIDPEATVRRLVGTALRKHRAWSTLRDLAERGGGHATIEAFARELPLAFPAVDIAQTSWVAYARAFLFWMEYAGLVVKAGINYRPASDTVAASMRLLDAPSPLKFKPGVPYVAPRRSVEMLARLANGAEFELPSESKQREYVGALFALGAVTVTPNRMVRLKVADLITAAGAVDPSALRRLLESVPGGRAGLDVIAADPAATPQSVGAAIAAASQAEWTEQTTHGVGGHFRAWAKVAGLSVKPPRRALTCPTVPPGQTSIFDLPS